MIPAFQGEKIFFPFFFSSLFSPFSFSCLLFSFSLPPQQLAYRSLISSTRTKTKKQKTKNTVWSQPLFECVELAVEHRVEKKRDGKWPLGLSEKKFRIIFRTIYVIACTFLALMLPFMGVILGLAGALGFWPATVRVCIFFFPFEVEKEGFFDRRKRKNSPFSFFPPRHHKKKKKNRSSSPSSAGSRSSSPGMACASC